MITGGDFFLPPVRGTRRYDIEKNVSGQVFLLADDGQLLNPFNCGLISF
jgi:hypothetical protein